MNPPGSTARVHQHLDIGQGEVDWDVFFATLGEVGFDGIATVCVFAWEERARESSAFMLDQIRQYLAKHRGLPGWRRAARDRAWRTWAGRAGSMPPTCPAGARPAGSPGRSRPIRKVARRA